MTKIAIYDADGLIVRTVTLTGDPIEDADLVEIPPGGDTVVGDYDSFEIYFPSGVETARPTVTVDPEYTIDINSTDAVTFTVPDGTDISTPEGDYTAVGSSDVVITAAIVGQFDITITPPSPYAPSDVLIIAQDLGGAVGAPPAGDIEILLSQSVLTNLAVLAKPKFNVLSWDISSDPEHDHYGLTRYESEADADADTAGIDIEPITEAFYKDADEFVNGVDCWYRVYDVDTNGNRSDKSDPAGEVARGVQTGDVEDAAVTPRKADLGDTTNLVRANDMADVNLFESDVAGAASGVSFITLANANGDLGPSRNKIRFTYSLSALPGGAADRAFLDTLPTNPCVGGYRYTASAFVKYVSGSTSGRKIYLEILWYELDASGAPAYLSTSTEHDFAGIDAVDLYLEFAAVAPATAAFFALRIRCDPGVFSGQTVIDIGSLSVTEMDFGLVETTDFVGTESVIAGNTKSFMRMTSNHSKSARSVSFSGALKNNSGGARAITWEFIKIADPLGAAVVTSLKSLSMTLPDEGMIQLEFVDNAPTNGFTDYAIWITAGASAFSANNRFMITKATYG